MGDHAHQQAQAPTTAQARAAAQAPAPKVASGSEPLPSPQDLVDPKTRASFDGLGPEALLATLSPPLEIAREKLQRRLDYTVEQLRKSKELPKADSALPLIAKVVEIVTGFALSAISHVAMDWIEKRVGEDGRGATVDALGDTAKELAKKGGPAVASLFEENAADAAAKAKDVNQWSMPAAESLLDEFKFRQSDALDNALIVGKVSIERLRSQLPRLDPQKLQTLATDLTNLITSEKFGREFVNKITFEWLNFSTRLSLGHAASDDGPTFAGANMPGGFQKAGDHGHEAWRRIAPEGPMSIMVNVPDEIYGIAGLTLESVHLSAGPGALDIAKRSLLPLSRVPIFREIWFVNSSNRLAHQNRAFVVTPTGQREVDLGNPVLAAIGSMKPVAFDELQEHRSDNPAPNSGEVFRGGQAAAGAAVVEKWLTLFTTEKLS